MWWSFSRGGNISDGPDQNLYLHVNIVWSNEYWMLGITKTRQFWFGCHWDWAALASTISFLKIEKYQYFHNFSVQFINKLELILINSLLGPLLADGYSNKIILKRLHQDLDANESDPYRKDKQCTIFPWKYLYFSYLAYRAKDWVWLCKFTDQTQSSVTPSVWSIMHLSNWWSAVAHKMICQ